MEESRDMDPSDLPDVTMKVSVDDSQPPGAAKAQAKPRLTQYCSVSGCHSAYGKGEAIRMFRFPARNAHKRAKWVEALQRNAAVATENWQPKPHHLICSKHFLGGQPSHSNKDPAFVPSIFPSKHGARSTAAKPRRPEGFTERCNIRLEPEEEDPDVPNSSTDPEPPSLRLSLEQINWPKKTVEEHSYSLSADPELLKRRLLNSERNVASLLLANEQLKCEKDCLEKVSRQQKVQIGQLQARLQISPEMIVNSQRRIVSLTNFGESSARLSESETWLFAEKALQNCGENGYHFLQKELLHSLPEIAAVKGRIKKGSLEAGSKNIPAPASGAETPKVVAGKEASMCNEPMLIEGDRIIKTENIDEEIIPFQTQENTSTDHFGSQQCLKDTRLEQTEKRGLYETVFVKCEEADTEVDTEVEEANIFSESRHSGGSDDDKGEEGMASDICVIKQEVVINGLKVDMWANFEHTGSNFE